mgnify:CR=1 FL=1
MAISSNASPKAENDFAFANQKLAAFENAIQEFNKDQSIESMLAKTLPDAAKAVEMDMLAVYLLDPEGRNLHPAFQIGIADNSPLSPIVIDSDDGISAWTQDRGAKLFAQEPRLGGSKQPSAEKADNVPPSSCCLPLIAHGAPAGIMVCSRKDTASAIDAKDKAFITDIAGLVSLAIGSGIPNSDILQRERAERSLQFAHMLQRSFTPSSIPQLKGWRVDCHRISALEMGGDFYDALLLPGDRIISIIGQASGQGVEAGLTISWIVADLRRILAGGASLSEAMAAFNTAILERMRRGVLVSLAMIEIKGGSKSCSLCSAGAIDVFQADTKGHLTPISEDSSPIGAFSGHTFTVNEIKIQQ